MRLSSGVVALLLLLDLEQERAVDVWQNTTEGDRGVDESIKLLVASDGELQVPGCNALDLEILGSVACQFENFGGQVFQDCCDVDGSFGADAHLVLGSRLEETLDTSAGELVEEELLASLLSMGMQRAVLRSVRVGSQSRRIVRKSRFCADSQGDARQLARSSASISCMCHVPEVQPSQSVTSGSFQMSHHQPCRRSYRQSCL